MTERDFPGLCVTDIRPARVDEWRGVIVNFEWAGTFDIEGYRAAARAEESAWFEAHPDQGHAGLFPLEKAMGRHIASRIVASPEWKAFFSKPRTVPRPEERDFTDWDFDARGGEAHAGRG